MAILSSVLLVLMIIKTVTMIKYARERERAVATSFLRRAVAIRHPPSERRASGQPSFLGREDPSSSNWEGGNSFFSIDRNNDCENTNNVKNMRERERAQRFHAIHPEERSSYRHAED